MAMGEMVIREFERALFLLKDWPDKNTIFDITIFASTHHRFAAEIVDILFARLLSPATHAALKVPLFYLVDSILKTVGGHFVVLFSAHIDQVFRRTFDELHDMDKARMDYMLSTWERRGQLPPELIFRMRSHIGARIVNTFRAASMAPILGGMGGMADPHMKRLQEQQWTGGQFDPLDKRPRVGVDPAVLLNEMNRLLGHMYTGLSVAERLSLDDVRVKNPALYEQIRSKAEDALRPLSNASFQNSASAASKQLSNGFRAPVSGTSKHQQQQQSFLSTQQQQLQHDTSDSIRAFVAENVVNVDPRRLHALSSRLQQFVQKQQPYTALINASNLACQRLDSLLGTVLPAPGTNVIVSSLKLPSVLTHSSLPSAPIPGMRPQQTAEIPVPNIVKISAPRFTSEDLLLKKPTTALWRLYGENTFLCKQDGLRFSSRGELARHLDDLFKKKAAEEKSEKKLDHRSWYSNYEKWVSEGQFAVPTHLEARDGSSGAVEDGQDIYVVSFDEHFVRCPVSKEPFETFWDDEEGGLMFRNAVKVLVTEAGDTSLWTASRPTDVEGIRYCIVHKLLVLDGWMQSGKVCALSSSLIGEGARKDSLVEAAGEDDEEDVFVVLESTTVKMET